MEPFRLSSIALLGTFVLAALSVDALTTLGEEIAVITEPVDFPSVSPKAHNTYYVVQQKTLNHPHPVFLHLPRRQRASDGPSRPVQRDRCRTRKSGP